MVTVQTPLSLSAAGDRMGTTLENSRVYIDLDAALDVRRLPGAKELIQQSAYAQLKRLLTERLEDLRKPEKPDEPKDDDGTSLFIDRRQNAIAIHGGRGTGKTTFVRNAFALLKDDKSLGDSIATLGVVDPTLSKTRRTSLLSWSTKSATPSIAPTTTLARAKRLMNTSSGGRACVSWPAV
jgi:hypothetical protein